jgi:hypothetical protein
VVVGAVFEGEFIAGGSVGVMIAGKGLDEAGALRGDDKTGLA